MIARSILLSGAVIAAGLLCAGASLAQDSAINVAGWNLADVGHKPGDDSDRLVSIEKDIAQVDFIYRPSESNTGGSIQATFRDKSCSGLNLSSGFDLPDAPAERLAAVHKEIDEAYADFAKGCRKAVSDEATLLQGFDEAFAAVDTLMKAKPNVYPPQPADDGNSQ